MSMFQGLEEEKVRDILARHDSNVDAAMTDLFALYEEHKNAAKEGVRRKQLEQTTRLLQRGFAGIDRAIIEEVVARYGGDMELASQELLRIMAAQLERDEAALLQQKTKQLEAKQEEERKLRAQIIDHCVSTFDVLTREEVQETLRKFNYDLPKAVTQLRTQSQSRKLRNLQHVFSTASEEHLRRALESTEYDLSRAFALLRGSGEKAQAPAVPEEEALQRSVVRLNQLAPEDKEAQGLLADMLRINAGPAGPAVAAAAAANNNNNNKDVSNAADGALPASLTVALAASATRFAYGQSVELVATIGGGEATAYDWVGLFDAQENNASPLTWSWFKPGKPVVLAFPAYGMFEARYLRKVNGEIRTLARSSVLYCGPHVQMQVDSKSSPDNWVVTYAWDDKTEKLTSSAWVGLYAVGALSANYVAFQYLPAAQGSLTFKKRLVNGSFEFRFFPYKLQGPVAVSEPVVVNNVDTVAFDRVGEQLVVKTVLATLDPAVNTRVWVAVCFKNDERPNKYRRSAYVTKPAQVFEFKAPIHAGLYECRLYDDSCKLLATSAEFQVN
jgi:NACalpha-BTF3-like transcription factor